MKILVINSGSSSLKFQLFEMPAAKVLASGMVERIGIDGSEIHYKTATGKTSEKTQINDHTEALKKVTGLLLDSNHGVLQNVDEVGAVGHRVVHGGSKFTETTLVNDQVKKSIGELTALAPLHSPANLTGIEVAEKIFPETPQIVVFDTAFFQSIPQKAYQYAIPKELLEKEDIRQYGFHGTSHKYVSEKAIDFLKKTSNKYSKIISIHLGNGCSITAIKDGKAVDHSMGFSPANGLVMGTRAGDIDQSVLFYLMETLGYSAQEVNTLLNKESGMLGLTGYSDLRDIEAEAEKGNKTCQLALALNTYRIKKYIGAYAAALNGLDALIFTAGIGENSSKIREMTCAAMDFFGIALDPAKNELRESKIRGIHAENSAVQILIVPTNEELEIANQTFKLVNQL
ncbi:acetate/propionate family kinase [Flavimarina sp. Hel_I_48]|uniref:acetate/propionate family kinase n=1 Tax=Flavimarina sp. Hel_I_48 TaxID=1392488 RepID=UPI0004DEE099|nr:acetate kinase [Flavimarina sp. Hel_I_48]